jgi:hypothetical protein
MRRYTFNPDADRRALRAALEKQAKADEAAEVHEQELRDRRRQLRQSLHLKAQQRKALETVIGTPFNRPSPAVSGAEAARQQANAMGTHTMLQTQAQVDPLVNAAEMASSPAYAWGDGSIEQVRLSLTERRILAGGSSPSSSSSDQSIPTLTGQTLVGTGLDREKVTKLPPLPSSNHRSTPLRPTASQLSQRASTAPAGQSSGTQRVPRRHRLVEMELDRATTVLRLEEEELASKAAQAAAREDMLDLRRQEDRARLRTQGQLRAMLQAEGGQALGTRDAALLKMARGGLVVPSSPYFDPEEAGREARELAMKGIFPIGSTSPFAPPENPLDRAPVVLPQGRADLLSEGGARHSDSDADALGLDSGSAGGIVGRATSRGLLASPLRSISGLASSSVPHGKGLSVQELFHDDCKLTSAEARAMLSTTAGGLLSDPLPPTDPESALALAKSKLSSRAAGSKHIPRSLALRIAVAAKARQWQLPAVQAAGRAARELARSDGGNGALGSVAFAATRHRGAVLALSGITAHTAMANATGGVQRPPVFDPSTALARTAPSNVHAREHRRAVLELDASEQQRRYDASRELAAQLAKFEEQFEVAENKARIAAEFAAMKSEQ